MKILLLGNTGQVGWELNRTLLTVGDLIAIDYPKIDMSNPNSIRTVVREIKPDLIVNATAYTNVDKAESELELAMAVNGTGPGVLAEEAKKNGAFLIHYSTDFVFNGIKKKPYTEEDEPNPINMYGRTKLIGEQAVQSIDGLYLIFRTSWVYSNRRPCFITKVMKWAEKNTQMSIVDDQTSTPTWSRVIAEATAQVIIQGCDKSSDYFEVKKGLYHLSAGGYCSRFEWAREILRLEQLSDTVLTAAKSSDFKTPAVRPIFSPLDCSLVKKTFEINIPHWKIQLEALYNKL